MQIGVKFIASVAILIYIVERRFVNDIFIQETVAVRCLVVSIRYVSYRNTLGTVFLSHPVGVRKIDSYRR